MANTARRAPARAQRSLAPKEHGAYGQLGVPLAAALAAGAPSASALFFTLAAGATFVAHEPLLIVVGQRGERVRREHGARARVRLVWLTLGACAAGAGALVTAAPNARLALLAPALLAVVLGWFIARRREKTALGETVAAAALAAASLPVALSGGLEARVAFGAWFAWCVGFAATTIAVRFVIARAHAGAERDARAPKANNRGLSPSARPNPLGRAGAGLCLAASALAMGFGALLAGPVVWAAAPLVGLSCALWGVPPQPRHVRRIGWALVAASLACAAIAVVVART